MALPALDLLASAGSQGDVGVLRDEMCACQPAASIHILAINLNWAGNNPFGNHSVI